MAGLFVHAGDEFLDMSKYLIIGALLTACIQTFIPRDEMLSLSEGTVGSYAFMMGFAYILSLCSTSDAFVATAFSHTFTLAAGSLSCTRSDARLQRHAHAAQHLPHQICRHLGLAHCFTRPSGFYSC